MPLLVALLCGAGLTAAALRDSSLALWVLLPMNAATFLSYAHDKGAAKLGRRRVSENTLLLMAAFGGWLGAGAAQQVFRHKTSKASFRTRFAGIAAVHIGVALGALFNR